MRRVILLTLLLPQALLPGAEPALRLLSEQEFRGLVKECVPDAPLTTLRAIATGRVWVQPVGHLDQQCGQSRIGARPSRRYRRPNTTASFASRSRQLGQMAT